LPGVYSAGFEVNDMILEVNGHTIEGFQGFVELVNHLRPHGRMTLLGLDHRSGRTGYVQVVAP
jgi:serine protease Do